MDTEIITILRICRRDGTSPVKAVRRFRRMKFRGLAHAARMDPAHLDLIESRSMLAAPSRAELDAIASALDVPSDALR